MKNGKPKEKLTEDEAKATVRHLKATQGALMTAYRCLHTCYLPNGSKAWHVGH